MAARRLFEEDGISLKATIEQGSLFSLLRHPGLEAQQASAS